MATAFVLDDSVVKQNCSKKAELLARIYNHKEYKYQCGFSILTFGLYIKYLHSKYYYYTLLNNFSLNSFVVG